MSNNARISTLHKELDEFQHLLAFTAPLFIQIDCQFQVVCSCICAVDLLIGHPHSSVSTCSFFTLPISFILSELSTSRNGSVVH